MPRVSFICPVFRTEKHLAKCLRSLAKQSLQDFEVIVVLDGPSEEARDITRTELAACSYQIVEIPHGGACRARNEGFDRSTGDIVCFWDSDCVIEKEAARAWVEIFDEKPEVGFVYAGYKWFDENAPAYNSEEWDPWLLRVNNYISTCFPVRRSLAPKWDESLKSLQDWDFWLTVVERGGVGHHMKGYAWSTALPSGESISAIGCKPENWLERLDAVKAKHGIAIREVCVSSLSDRHEGIRLAKLINADYRDYPLSQPNHYKTVIQIGFSFQPTVAEIHASVFGDKRKYKNVLFWTDNDITEVYHMVGRKAQLRYSELLNNCAAQFVEDKESQRIMELCGFKTEVLPLPFHNTMAEAEPMPEKPRFLLDISAEYSHVMNAVERALPDVKLDMAGGAQKISDYSGLIHYRIEPVMSSSIKRMLLAGRYVISNVQQPFAGFIDDKQAPDTFIPAIVDKVREVTDKPVNRIGKEFYDKMLCPAKLEEVLK